jgi:hypothetical protein
MSEQFHGPRLKIERAKQHIADLNANVEILRAGGVYVLRIHRDPRTGNEQIEAEITQVVSPSLGLIIGDAIHNLKTALDFTVNEVVFRRLGAYDDFTRFPFRETRDELVKAVNGALVKRASTAVADFIVNKVNPYRGGNDPLWALHTLDILDKHRLLLPVLNISFITGIVIKHSEGMHGLGHWAITGRRSSIQRLDGLKNCEIANDGEPTVLVFFDKGFPFEGKPVIPTLHQIADFVGGVVEGIEDVFFAEGRALEIVKP